MRKKGYRKPHMRIIEIDNKYCLLAESTTPTGYSLDYDDEENDDEVIKTVGYKVWDR